MSASIPKSIRLSAPLLFLIGFGLFMFTDRSEILPSTLEMIVIAPIFILRFSRNLLPRRAMALTTFGFVLSLNIALWGFLTFPIRWLGWRSMSFAARFWRCFMRSPI
jgi:hypothetical protein